ncbi:serine protease 55-like [Uranotaenia lowii]|uniref:serine protease 55-like n=1 Tax=Uranotaenia lowii TaxID=190385 RepID=UPI002478F457|nr:serine protease 55-like [Uranotaenia lowii]
MNFLITLLIPLTLAATTPPNPTLIGGTNSNWGDFPSAVFIRTPILSYCGAAIVHPRFILTLAHCVYDDQLGAPMKQNQVEVVAGDIHFYPASYQRQQPEVVEIIVHRNYTSYNHNADIALLRLGTAFQLPSNTVDVAIRQQRIVANAVSCQLPGWGVNRNAANGIITAEQKYIQLPILDRDFCNGVSLHEGRIRENMLCAGTMLQSYNAPCTGNFGSPLYCEGQLTGLLTFGANCGAENDPPVFTQVRFFNRWIDEEIQRRL